MTTKQKPRTMPTMLDRVLEAYAMREERAQDEAELSRPHLRALIRAVQEIRRTWTSGNLAAAVNLADETARAAARDVFGKDVL